MLISFKWVSCRSIQCALLGHKVYEKLTNIANVFSGCWISATISCFRQSSFNSRTIFPVSINILRTRNIYWQIACLIFPGNSKNVKNWEPWRRQQRALENIKFQQQGMVKIGIDVDLKNLMIRHKKETLIVALLTMMMMIVTLSYQSLEMNIRNWTQKKLIMT